MRNWLKYTIKLFATVMALLMFICMSGFGVYKHTCITSHKGHVSFFIPVNSCEHGEASDQHESCCTKQEVPGCCQISNETDDQDCCFDYDEYKKLEAVTLLWKEVIEISPVNSIVLQILFSRLPVLCDSNCLSNHNFKEGPPLIVPTNTYLAKNQVFII